MSREGQGQVIRELLPTLVPEGWTCWQGAYGQGERTVAGLVVIGRGVPVLRWHQRDAGSARQREWRRRARAHDAAYQRRDRPGHAAETDAWMVLFSTAADWRTALRCYRRRWATESSYRDLQSGWDGRHGWDLEPVVARQTTATRVAALWGLCALAQLVQQWLGSQICHPASPSAAGYWPWAWTVHGRLSVWACGRLALTSHVAGGSTWCSDTLARGTALLATASLPACSQRPRPLSSPSTLHLQVA